MIPKECKRLAEVDFPIAAVSAHSAREKSIRHGHPSTLHLWWARRPLAACRSMLMALLLPDPCDPNCPKEFKEEASRILLDFLGRPQRWDWELAGKPAPKKDHEGKAVPTRRSPDEGLRHILLHEFIADFANWDNAANPAYLKTARALVKAAHGAEPPLVVDPFAGGGSIPLEALRIGCDAFASDLNPVACLINKVLLEDIPRHGPKLAEELRRVGAEIKKQAEKELAEFYPPDADGARPIAYLWARTVRCEQPNCGCEIPLVRSFWLCKKARRRRALRHEVIRANGVPPRVEFEVFEPGSEKEVGVGIVTGAKATCPACGAVLVPESVRAQLTAKRGGADVILDSGGGRAHTSAQLLAVVTLRHGEQGRHYRLPTAADYQAVLSAHSRLSVSISEWERDEKEEIFPVPNERVNPTRPSANARGMSAITRYGMNSFGDLFTRRQTLAFLTISRLIRNATCSKEVRSLLALVCTKLADRSNCLVNWSLAVECPNQMFKGNGIAMSWDFAESNVLSEASASVQQSVENVAKNVEAAVIHGAVPTTPSLSDARESPLPDESAPVWFTDPPYYDAIPYADLSDFFFVWLKRILPDNKFMHDPFDGENALTPKQRECVWNAAHTFNGRPKDKAFFESTISACFGEGRRLLRKDGVAGVVFAHQTTEGWEAFLGGLMTARWTVTGSWPIATERASRIRARENASLATSIHLVCRPRDDDAGVGDWGEIVRELPKRIGDWMERLSSEGIRGADLVFACIGPALELFSKYASVETPDGEQVGLAANNQARDEPARRGFLSYVWEYAGRTALNQVLGSAESRARNGAAGALEEDARLTALFLWTLQATDAAANGKDQSRARKQAVSDEDDDEGSVTV